MTSAVARFCAESSCSAATVRSRGAGPGGADIVSPLTTRAPRPVPVASMTTMSASFSDVFVRTARTIGTTVMSPMNTGPRKVATRNHFERTRSRYSRLKTTNILPMAGHPGLDTLGADPIEEDLLERRLNELESAERRTCGDDASQQLLRVGPRR